jgi:hypothetical protein
VCPEFVGYKAESHHHLGYEGFSVLSVNQSIIYLHV